MNLWFGHFLFAALFLCSSALTPEECKPLVTPLSLADPSMMFGRTNFLVGYTDTELYNNMLKVTDSSWLNISASDTPNKVIISQENKMGGKCLSSLVGVTIDGDTATTSYANVTSVFHLLPSCDGCLVFNINSRARNIEKFLSLMNMTSTAEEITTHALYLLGPESTLKDSDLEHFKKQASCLGFSREPDFVYNPENGFCAEGEGIKMPF
ncbi:uncharacterized protein AKAME5_002146400 [Lates japonicus]|uniref:Uncharacterized protein n=1 Tax=Lates japonicus TaxID=270547 RepID=A0AAD3NF97_LATJO|nr:uncharacterized protein AKAME5_002146100 [Lates japonicus]GLD70147.1 uncharacterized protein AKAME5_002146400 [Lates japonicus]